MPDFLNPSWFWLPCGLLAFTLGLINLIRSMAGKRKGRELLSVGSFTFALAAMLTEYAMVTRWVHTGDWSALMDVVPSMCAILTGCVALGVLLNGIALCLGRKKPA